MKWPRSGVSFLCFLIVFSLFSCYSELNRSNHFQKVMAQINEVTPVREDIEIYRPEFFEGILSIYKYDEKSYHSKIGAKIAHKNYKIIKICLNGLLRGQHKELVFYLYNNKEIFAIQNLEGVKQSQFYFYSNKNFYSTSTGDFSNLKRLSEDPCFQVLNEFYVEGLRLF